MKPVRSILCIPGHRADWIEKARANNLYGADMLLLDLEDSVPAARKEEARENVRQALYPGCAVRLSANLLEDLHAINDGLGYSWVWVPKVSELEDARSVRRWLDLNGRSQSRVVACLESPEPIVRIEQFLRPGVDGLAYGKHDFIASAGLSLWQTGAIDHAAAQVALAAAARGVPCWMAPSHEVEDSSKLWHEAKRALELGFTGMGCIAPWQVPVVNACFGGEEHEASQRWFDRDRATRLLAAADANPTEAVFRTEDGDLVSPPTVAWARRVLGC